jgi:hypothetical protein
MDCFEDELVPLLERAGAVYELRIAMSTNPAIVSIAGLGFPCLSKQFLSSFTMLFHLAILRIASLPSPSIATSQILFE